MSKLISLDIIKYLQDKGHSVEDMASIMDITIKDVKNIAHPYNKSVFTTENINTYLKFSNLKFWELATEAIPLDHLSKKARTRVLFCKEVSGRMKKKHLK